MAPLLLGVLEADEHQRLARVETLPQVRDRRLRVVVARQMLAVAALEVGVGPRPVVRVVTGHAVGFQLRLPRLRVVQQRFGRRDPRLVLVHRPVEPRRRPADDADQRLAGRWLELVVLERGDVRVADGPAFGHSGRGKGWAGVNGFPTCRKLLAAGPTNCEPMEDVQVQGATVADADALAAVYRSACRESRRLGFPMKAESATAEQVADWIREHRVHVATVGEGAGDEVVVGGVRLAESDADRVKLSRLGVHEDWKGNEVGSRLLDHAEAAARDAGYDAVRLTTPEEHPHLPEFYRRRGYEKTGEYPLEYREYDEIVMEKRLE